MKKFFSAAAIICTIGLTTVSLNSCKGDDAPTQGQTGNVNVDPNNLSAKLSSGQNLVLKAGTTYQLKGAIIVNDGATLTIEAGTKIICSGETSTYIGVAQGGKIFINGTAANPVVFEGANKRKADWGGIVLAGRAPINNGGTTGVQTSEVGALPYGGTNEADNSGVITYTVIKHSGARFDATKEYNGLSLFGVGNGTKIDGVSIIDGADDGIEFFGGTVNVSNIVSVNNDDDAFDWTDGWKGTATNVYGKRTAANVGNRGIEADNQASNNDADPRSNPTLRNTTFIGFTTTDNENAGTNLLRRGTYATIDNMVVSGWAVGLTFESASTISYFTTNVNALKNVRFDNVGEKIKGLDASVLARVEKNDATGAGNGINVPTWAANWAGIN